MPLCTAGDVGWRNTGTTPIEGPSLYLEIVWDYTFAVVKGLTMLSGDIITVSCSHQSPKGDYIFGQSGAGYGRMYQVPCLPCGAVHRREDRRGGEKSWFNVRYMAYLWHSIFDYCRGASVTAVD